MAVSTITTWLWQWVEGLAPREQACQAWPTVLGQQGRTPPNIVQQAQARSTVEWLNSSELDPDGIVTRIRQHKRKKSIISILET